MIVELKPAHYEGVRSLFDGLWYHLNLFAVIEGKCPGQIFADDAASPTVALICEQVEGNWYLAGDCSDPEVVEGLRSLIADTLLPAGRATDGMVELLINWHPDAWEDHFGICYLADIAPMRHLRKHFVIDSTPLIDWRGSFAHRLCVTAGRRSIAEPNRTGQYRQYYGDGAAVRMRPCNR